MLVKNGQNNEIITLHDKTVIYTSRFAYIHQHSYVYIKIHRIAINKFRLGNQKLRIETGRHTIPKTPLNLRICSFCHSNEVENEIHFLFSCQLYDSLCLNLFNDITDKYSLFNELDINAKVLFLFNSIDPFVCRSTATFVFQAMSLRHEISSVKGDFECCYIFFSLSLSFSLCLSLSLDCYPPICYLFSFSFF